MIRSEGWDVGRQYRGKWGGKVDIVIGKRRKFIDVRSEGWDVGRWYRRKWGGKVDVVIGKRSEVTEIKVRLGWVRLG